MPDLSSYDQLSPYLEKLTAMGLQTVEELFSVGSVEPHLLGQFLDVDIESLLGSLGFAPPAIPPDLAHEINTSPFEDGVALAELKVSPVAYSVSAPALAALPAVPPMVNLIPQMPPIAQQGARQTCVAFVAAALMEHAVKREVQYSPQYLYWNCKQQDGVNYAGTMLSVGVPLTVQDGCCYESTWHYNPRRTHGLDDQGPPPNAAHSEAPRNRMNRSQRLAPTSVNDIKAELAAGRPVGVTIPVFSSWKNSMQVAASGDITNPIPGETWTGGHALCFVGYQDLPSSAWGGGKFIVRNSWGTTWGNQCPFGAGHGTIAYSFVARYGAEAFNLL